MIWFNFGSKYTHLSKKSVKNTLLWGAPDFQVTFSDLFVGFNADQKT